MEDRRKRVSRLPDTEVVTFNGVHYTRRPGRKYFKTMRWDKQRKCYYAESLHQAVWKFHHGEIPEGHDVHHKDDDYDNNVIDNLELLTRSDHAKLHDRFAEYNGTPEAKEHRDRARKLVWERAVYKPYICEHCSGEFQSRRAIPPRFCSEKCGHAFRYAAKKRARLRPGG
jgi:hypothetical protein